MSSPSLRLVPRLLPAAVLVACAGLAAWRDYGSILAPDWLPYAVVLALVVGAIALRVRFGSDPGALYVCGRLDFPVSYPNANAAFFLVGFWPAIGLAARRAWPVAARAASLAGATALLASWLLTQSKGGGAALLVSAIVFFAICPARLRALLPTLVAAALVGAAF